MREHRTLLPLPPAGHTPPRAGAGARAGDALAAEIGLELDHRLEQLLAFRLQHRLAAAASAAADRDAPYAPRQQAQHQDPDGPGHPGLPGRVLRQAGEVHLEGLARVELDVAIDEVHVPVLTLFRALLHARRRIDAQPRQLLDRDLTGPDAMRRRHLER